VTTHTTIAIVDGQVAHHTTEMPEQCPDHPLGPCADCWGEYGVVTCHDDHDDYCPFDEPDDWRDR
jgi:hypothetical protein